MEKVSIVVPVYNAELYLKECIESILAQSYKNIEIIIVNDGSTDGSGEICDEFSLNYSNIKVIHQENKGLPFARNAGLEMATGEYIGFVDSDDIIKKDMFSNLILKLKETNADMAVCNFELFNKKGVRAVSNRYKDDIYVFLTGKEELFYCHSLDSVWNKVFKHEIIKENNILFEDKGIVAQEDFWFLVRYCSHISRIVSISAPLYMYRERGSSITKSGVDNDISERCIKFIQLSEEYINSVLRKANKFLEEMTLEMLYASINQLKRATPKKIYSIVKLFCIEPYYKNAIHRKSLSIKNFRALYDTIKNICLRCKLYYFFSCMECLRVRRLHGGSKVNDQFE